MEPDWRSALEPAAILLGGGRLANLILAPRRASAAFDDAHPGRRASPATPAPPRQAFERHNRLFNLLSFLAQISKHFQDIHEILTNLPTWIETAAGGSENGTSDSKLLVKHS